MENTTTTNPVKTAKSKRGKGVAKAVTAFTVGAALLFGGNTFAVWESSQSIGQHQTITAGELSIERARSAGSWTLNGTPLAESELSSVKLVPGDTVAYAGSEAPRVVGDTLTGYMYFQGVEGTQNALAGATGATMDWSVAGKQEALQLTSADHLADKPVAFSVSLDARSDNASHGLTLDLSSVQVAVSILKPVEEQGPELGWIISDPVLKAAVIKQLTGEELSGQELADHRLTWEDATSLTRLDAGKLPAMTSLDGLEAAVNLTFLDFRESQVSDLGPISGLSQLTLLYAFESQISDLTPLTGLKNLTNLGIAGTKVTSVAPLAQLPKLKFLIAQKLAVTDWSPVSHVSNVLKD